MSDTKKQGKRHRIVAKKCRSLGQELVLKSRHGFGMSEKIRRRNRKTWTRLFQKIGRQLDKKEIKISLDTKD